MEHRLIYQSLHDLPGGVKGQYGYSAHIHQVLKRGCLFFIIYFIFNSICNEVKLLVYLLMSYGFRYCSKSILWRRVFSENRK